MFFGEVEMFKADMNIFVKGERKWDQKFMQKQHSKNTNNIQYCDILMKIFNL
jgi:hypothetical protein